MTDLTQPDLTLAGISGSLRADSFNTRLVREAARLFAPAEFTMGDLRLPLYDGDLEAQGIPPEVQALGAVITRADALVIGNPEYNKGMSGVLKNALDWLSRLKPNPLAGKPVALVSAAGGRAGGEVSQYQARHNLAPHNARVLTGNYVLVGNASEHFDSEGRLVTESYAAALTRLMAALRDEAARG